MKQTDNRQNKLQQIKAQTHPFQKVVSENLSPASADAALGIRRGGAVYGLVKDILVATKIAQAGKHCHLAVHNFDKAEPLVAHTKEKKPILIILDWDACEAEAFKVLKEIQGNADLKGVPSIGYISQSKSAVREEAQRAGCHRVYTKTEFMHDLENILARYAQ